MRHMSMIACVGLALSACGGKEEVVENGSAVENISLESTPANDASALEAVEAEDSRLAAVASLNEAEPDDSEVVNTDANESANSY